MSLTAPVPSRMARVMGVPAALEKSEGCQFDLYCATSMNAHSTTLYVSVPAAVWGGKVNRGAAETCPPGRTAIKIHHSVDRSRLNRGLLTGDDVRGSSSGECDGSGLTGDERGGLRSKQGLANCILSLEKMSDYDETHGVDNGRSCGVRSDGAEMRRSENGQLYNLGRRMRSMEGFEREKARRGAEDCHRVGGAACVVIRVPVAPLRRSNVLLSSLPSARWPLRPAGTHSPPLQLVGRAQPSSAALLRRCWGGIRSKKHRKLQRSGMLGLPCARASPERASPKKRVAACIVIKRERWRKAKRQSDFQQVG